MTLKNHDSWPAFWLPRLGAAPLAANADSATKPAAPAAAAPAATGPAAAGTTPQSSTAGLPQDQETANRPAQQNWLKVCDPIPAGQKAAGQRACILRQVVVANNQFLGSFLLRDDPGQESRLLAVAAVPLGVLLPFGLTWQIDGQKPVRVPYMALCDPQNCAQPARHQRAVRRGAKEGFDAQPYRQEPRQQGSRSQHQPRRFRHRL